jgi:hypothetical protein
LKALEASTTSSHLHLTEHAGSTEAASKAPAAEEIIVIIEETATKATSKAAETPHSRGLFLLTSLGLHAERSSKEIVFFIEKVCKWVPTTEELSEDVLCISVREP